MRKVEARRHDAGDDASRVVDVVSALLDPARRGGLDTENRELQEKLRVQHAVRTDDHHLGRQIQRRSGCAVDDRGHTIRKP